MTTLETALSLLDSGISAIPVRADKTPLLKTWRKYITEAPSRDEVEKFFSDGASIALVGGKVQCIDVDEKYQSGLMVAFEKRVREHGLGNVWDKAIIQRTPSGGYHLVFITDCEPIRNMKLAQKGEDERFETLIETRGTGGYFLIAPSKGYEVIQGDFDFFPVFTQDERDDLLDIARSFDIRAPREAVTASKLDDISPGDDYDSRGDVVGLLRSHGWTQINDKHWRRPGKDRGISASFGVIPDRFWVFSTSTAFESEHVYRPWHVYAVLEHGGDYQAAAKALRMLGYGSERKPEKVTGLEASLPSSDPKASLEKAISAKDEQKEIEEQEALLAKLAEVEFNPGAEPENEKCIFKLAGVEIAHSGNHIAIVAPVKTGKSAAIGAAIASAVTMDFKADLLGFEPCNRAGHAVIHIDTEQSRNDHHRLLMRSLKRAGEEVCPDWLLSFCMTSWDPAEIIKAITFLCERAKQAFGGIHSIIIDGVADLVSSPNDEEESNAVERYLRSLAIKYGCSVVCVIHKNPGSDKSRGHLGSQLERKAETVLFLEKKNDVTIMYSDRTRHAPITKDKAPAFRWCDEAKAHVSCKQGVAQAVRNQLSGKAIPFEVEDLQQLLPQYGGKVTRKNVNAIAKIAGASVRTVWSRWKTLKDIQEKGDE